MFRFIVQFFLSCKVLRVILLVNALNKYCMREKKTKESINEMNK